MKWILLIVFASGAYATKEFPDEPTCEVAKSVLAKRIDIAFWMNPEHPTTPVRFISCEPVDGVIGSSAASRSLDAGRLAPNRYTPGRY